MERHVLIEAVRPAVDGGRWPAKGIAGEDCVVEADVFRDGDVLVRAEIEWRRKEEAAFAVSAMTHVDNDRFRGAFPLAAPGVYVYTVAGWSDGYGTWLRDLGRRVHGGQGDLTADVLDGFARIEAALRRAQGERRRRLREALARLESVQSEPKLLLAAAAEEALVEAMLALEERADRVRFEPELELRADRERAVFGAWYEMFVRSQATDPGKSGTFADAERRLGDVRAMGFDVVYLAPIHPIGVSHRKGRDDAKVAAPGDPGCPWAIGSEDGGHNAVEPSLGSLADFDRLVSAARSLGLEVALELALQASPDHPWVLEHPEWFRRRPDGSIRCAENPPYTYEDVVPFDFDGAGREALWRAVRDVVLFWTARGVKAFRVDNPHTKPLHFWRWLIAEVKSRHPDAIFLAEAFTRPKVMKALSKAGFCQSYTYFTWRTTKEELTGYLTELYGSGMEDYFRPNFFTNTHDVLPANLQAGGRAAFRLRALLAATLSPSWGIYSGFELCEDQAVAPGSQEYLHSEKYELKVRDWGLLGNIKEDIAQLNRIRREHKALSRLRGLTFLKTSHPALLAFARETPAGDDRVLVVANLDPLSPVEGVVRVPAGVAGGRDRFAVQDLLSGQEWTWGVDNWVRLDPAASPGHILVVGEAAPDPATSEVGHGE